MHFSGVAFPGDSSRSGGDLLCWRAPPRQKNKKNGPQCRRRVRNDSVVVDQSLSTRNVRHLSTHNTNKKQRSGQQAFVTIPLPAPRALTSERSAFGADYRRRRLNSEWERAPDVYQVKTSASTAADYRNTINTSKTPTRASHCLLNTSNVVESDTTKPPEDYAGHLYLYFNPATSYTAPVHFCAVNRRSRMPSPRT